MFERLKVWWNGPPPSAPEPKRSQLTTALAKAREGERVSKSYKYPIQPPKLAPGVVPKDQTAPVLAMDAAGPYGDVYSYAAGVYGQQWAGFPGYPYLAMLATKPEYRAFAESLSTEITREWLELVSSETAGDETKSKITELTKALKELGLQTIIQRIVEHDSYFGRGQIFLDVSSQQNRELPLVISEKTIPKGTKFRIETIEPMWTTPSAYNASDPTARDYYKPSIWYVMGQQVHASRLITYVSRPVPDMLKPAFNFSGMSMSQLAEPYVDNFLRTRESVSDLISNFSITALATSMDQVLQGNDNGADLFTRADLFVAGRDNRGLFLLDKDREELIQVNTPLSGLNELQAQSQEMQCAVSKTPSVVLLGIAPSGFGNVAEGEMATWENRVVAVQESFVRGPVERIVAIQQLCMYGEIDPDISIVFKALRQMTEKELSEIRAADATAGAAYIDRGVIDAPEERERLARDPESNYQGLDLAKEIKDDSEI